MMYPNGPVAASFRDPSGVVYWREGMLLRQVNLMYKDDYDHLMRSGLYNRLVETGRLIPHQEASLELANSPSAYKVIRPDVIPFISYPYEWCFSQLKDAAMLICEIQESAMEFGMSLKDSSAYNIQFVQGRPIMIDTLSFERYEEGKPWVAYRQFCQHFLAPLALMSYTYIQPSQLLKVFIDGVPLNLAAKLLPASSFFHLSLLFHVHLHAWGQQHFARTGSDPGFRTRKLNRQAVLRLVDHLKMAIHQLRWTAKTEWINYYETTGYTDVALEQKKQLVAKWVREINPSYIWDLGANTGLFSRVASESAPDSLVIAWDVDPGCVEIHYQHVVHDGKKCLLPLVVDLTNPSPALGWENSERMSLLERGPADVVLALALIHHLTIANNVPLERVAAFFARLGRWLIVEFIPKSDPQVRRLLSTRKDIFPDYTRSGFEAAFQKFFRLQYAELVPDSERILFLMEKR